MIPYSIKAVVKNRVKSNGCYPIRIRIIISCKKSEFSLNIEVKNINDFDEHKQLIKTSSFNADNYNNIIKKALQKSQQYFWDCDLKELPYSIDGFKCYWNKSDKSSHDFYAFAEDILSQIKGIVTNETLKQFKGEITKLKKFRKTLNFSDFDLKFIRSYEQYMILDLKNKTNTVAKTIKKIKRFLNLAVENNLIEKNPLEKYKVSTEKTNRTFLSMEELEKLETLYQDNQTNAKLKNVLQCFLFSCYTGLRYSDVSQLKWENIENNKINIVQEKTDENVYVPLIDKALNLLPDTKLIAGLIFNIYSNQKCNEYLKLIAILAGLKKNISFHTSRHTFATVSLNLGIRFEVVSKLLGHSDLKTTKIYARLLNETTDAEMLKWNRI